MCRGTIFLKVHVRNLGRFFKVLVSQESLISLNNDIYQLLLQFMGFVGGLQSFCFKFAFVRINVDSDEMAVVCKHFGRY